MEGCCCVTGPTKCFLLEEGFQWCRDDVVVVDEAPIVAYQPEEALQCLDCVDLGLIYGNTIVGDDMAEVGDVALSEHALGMLKDHVGVQGV